MNLLLFLPAVRSGGAERVMVVLANAWAEQGYGVTLATLNPGVDYFAVDGRVSRVRFDIPLDRRPVIGPLLSFLRKHLSIRRAIRMTRPDVVISFLNTLNIRVLLASSGLGIPIIISERIAPQRTSAGPIWRLLRRLTYPQAALLIAQTEREERWFRKVARRSMVIPNPIPEEVLAYSRKKSPPGTSRLVVAMGRLTAQKGFDLLLNAFVQARKAFPDCTLRIYGEGRQRQELERRIRELELVDIVTLPGNNPHPYRILETADLFVLSSRHEGFPNVLLEAMAIGVPVVAFDCPNGPRELIEDGRTGCLVEAENTIALSEALAWTLADSDEAGRMGAAAKEAVRATYALQAIAERWDSALRTVLG